MWNVISLCPFSSLIYWHLSFIFFVFLVTKYKKRKIDRILRCPLVQEILSPCNQMIIWSMIRNVIYENAAISSSIKGWPKRLITFLACSVPYLKGDCMSICTLFDFKLFAKKITTNCRLIPLRDCLSYVVLDDWCFANTIYYWF